MGVEGKAHAEFSQRFDATRSRSIHEGRAHQFPSNARGREEVIELRYRRGRHEKKKNERESAHDIYELYSRAQHY